MCKFIILDSFVFLLFIFNVNSLIRIDPLVDTNAGLIRGLQATDGNYSMFLGVPYAKVKETNPFGPSEPLPKFEKIFEAIYDSVLCPQLEDVNNTITGTLDCLQLNIYVPNSASSKNILPVLVWFYGGSFYRGFARRDFYGPKFIVRHDVILITVNYRIGPYGFMCLDIEDVPGNQGLKDQLGALRWIKNNIRAFGGNSNQVTLFGQSAGGRSVDFQLISEQEKLFDKVIMQSGNSICPPVISEVDTRPPLMLAEKIGFITDDVTEALKFLARVDPLTVIAASFEIDFTFRPCVEKDFENVEKFISNYTINKSIPKLKTTKALVGYNNNELILKYFNSDESYIENINIFEESLNEYFNFEKEHLNEMVKLVKQFYIGDEKIGKPTLQALTDFLSDFTYLHPTHRRTQQNILNEAQTIYHYVFSYNGERSLSWKRSNLTNNGAAHGDELGYLFDIPLYFKDKPLEDDQLMIDRMTTLWTNFVKFGDPTPIVSELLPVKWEPITDENFYYYNIDSELSLETRPFKERMAFWDLFFKYNQKFQKGYSN